jgi:hypothetical protein
VLYECNYKRIESVELNYIHSIGALKNQRAYCIRRIGQVKISSYLSSRFRENPQTWVQTAQINSSLRHLRILKGTNWIKMSAYLVGSLKGIGEEANTWLWWVFEKLQLLIPLYKCHLSLWVFCSGWGFSFG